MVAMTGSHRSFDLPHEARWRRVAVCALLQCALLASCGLWPASNEAGGAADTPAPISYQGLNAEDLGPHHARFELRFEADESWQYTLEKRVSEQAVEHSVRVEGVADARNPGPVRMVTQGDQSRMRGPGTDEACLLVPRAMELNISFITPDVVIPAAAIREPMVPMGQTEISGRPADQFALVQPELDDWQDVRLGIWLDRGTGAVLRYDLTASGWDRFFQAGFGELNGRYEVLAVGPQAIEPIEGCEVELPLPQGASNLVHLPGVVAFDVELGVEQVVNFYRDAMPQAGWQTLEEEQRGSGVVVLTYRRSGEQIEVTVRRADDRTRVELISDE